MAILKAELREILDRYGIDPRDKSQLWDCHGTLVLYHRAYEIIAAKEAIRFDAPVIIEADSKDKIVAMLVTGRMNDRSEWSIGEAAPANCKNAYPYAMAEKRAKDRVIAKLAGLAAYVYSEAEAEEFKDGAPVEPADARLASPPQRRTQPANGHAAPTSAPLLAPNPEEPPETAERRRIRGLIDKYDRRIKSAPHKQALELTLDDGRDDLAEIEAAGEKGRAAAAALRNKAMVRLAEFDERDA
jgi:hypothetical protein